MTEKTKKMILISIGCLLCAAVAIGIAARSVSYTHLDVYKRQGYRHWSSAAVSSMPPWMT